MAILLCERVYLDTILHTEINETFRFKDTALIKWNSSSSLSFWFHSTQLLFTNKRMSMRWNRIKFQEKFTIYPTMIGWRRSYRVILASELVYKTTYPCLYTVIIATIIVNNIRNCFAVVNWNKIHRTLCTYTHSNIFMYVVQMNRTIRWRIVHINNTQSY